jgi:hypothetical protein
LERYKFREYLYSLMCVVKLAAGERAGSECYP